MQSTKNTSNPLNKQLENVLLQHIVLSVYTLQFSLAWSRFSKGDPGTEGTKSNVIHQAYEAKCRLKERAVDFKSVKFMKFSRQFKTHNTGANSFLDACKRVST
jgi:hypothetical protein